MRDVKQKYIKKLILIFLVSLLFKSVWLFDNQDLGKLGNDDLSYWLHTATIVYDHDLNYEKDYIASNSSFNKFTNVPQHPPGAGYLSSPFVYLFSLLDKYEPERTNPVGSFAYLGFFWASLSYTLLGFYLIKKILILKRFKLRTIVMFASLVGTLTHFVTTRFMMSHAVEFFLCSCLCYLLETKKIKYSWKNSTLILMFYFLLSITRPTTFIYSLCLLVIYAKKDDFKLVNFLRFGSIFTLFSSIHTLLSNYLYGVPTIFQNSQIYHSEQGYTETSFLFIVTNTPKLINLVFSPSMGIFWCFPVIFYGLISVFANKNTPNIKKVYAKIFTFLYFYGAIIVLIIWQGREVTYGQRLLIGLLPFCIIKISEFESTKSYNTLFGISTLISYVGYLYFYSSQNLSLKLGNTLWGSQVRYSGEKYFLHLLNEFASIGNIVAILGKTIYSVIFFHFVNASNFINKQIFTKFLSEEKIQEAISFSEIYTELDTAFLLVATLLIFTFSTLFVQLAYTTRD